MGDHWLKPDQPWRWGGGGDVWVERDLWGEGHAWVEGVGQGDPKFTRASPSPSPLTPAAPFTPTAPSIHTHHHWPSRTSSCPSPRPSASRTPAAVEPAHKAEVTGELPSPEKYPFPSPCFLPLSLTSSLHTTLTSLHFTPPLGHFTQSSLYFTLSPHLHFSAPAELLPHQRVLRLKSLQQKTRGE